MIEMDPLFSIAEVLERSGSKGNSYRAGVSQMQRAVRAFAAHKKRGGNRRAKVGAARGRREAMVKIVRKGGTSTPGELKGQMNYLSRDGDLVFQGSDAYGGEILSNQEAKELADTWAESWKGKTNFGHTRHFIVSYPAGTSPDAAHRAGRDFAQRAFASGEYGDCWDYVTAFHTDGKGAHPHLHIIVNCKGMDEGTWLKTGKTAELSVDEMRALQVETAISNGIYMTNTTRLERGLSERVTDGGYWRQQGGHEVTPPINRDPAAEAAEAAAKVHHGMAYATLSEVVEEHDPEIAGALRSAADQMRHGKTIDPQWTEAWRDEILIEALDQIAGEYEREITAMAEKRTEITSPEGRHALDELEAEAKERFSPWLPERVDLTAYTISGDAEAQRYVDAAAGLTLSGATTAELKEEAKSLGIEPDDLVRRAQVGPDISLGRVADWMAKDLKQHLGALEEQGSFLSATEVEEGLHRLSSFYQRAAQAAHVHDLRLSDHSEGHTL